MECGELLVGDVFELFCEIGPFCVVDQSIFDVLFVLFEGYKLFLIECQGMLVLC